MALAVGSVLTNGISTSVTTARTTATFTPTAGGLVVVCLASRGSGHTAQTFTMSDSFAGGLGGWGKVVASYDDGSFLWSVAIAWAVAGASPGTHDVTMTWTQNQARWSWAVTEVTGQANQPPVWQETTGTGTGTTLTLATSVAPATSSLIIAAIGSGDLSITPDAAYTELHEANSGAANPINLEVQYDLTSPSQPSWSALTSGTPNAGVAIEVIDTIPFLAQVTRC